MTEQEPTNIITEPGEQRTGEVAPDPAGYIAISLLVVIVVLVALFSLALIVSA